MKVNIKIKSPLYAGRVYKDGLELRCQHLQSEVQIPCCNGDDCGCRGLHLAYCYDCRGEEITEQDAERMINEFLYEDF